MIILLPNCIFEIVLVIISLFILFFIFLFFSFQLFSSDVYLKQDIAYRWYSISPKRSICMPKKNHTTYKLPLRPVYVPLCFQSFQHVFETVNTIFSEFFIKKCENIVYRCVFGTSSNLWQETLKVIGSINLAEGSSKRKEGLHDDQLNENN